MLFWFPFNFATASRSSVLSPSGPASRLMASPRPPRTYVTTTYLSLSFFLFTFILAVRVLLSLLFNPVVSFSLSLSLFSYFLLHSSSRFLLSYMQQQIIKPAFVWETLGGSLVFSESCGPDLRTNSNDTWDATFCRYIGGGIDHNRLPSLRFVLYFFKLNTIQPTSDSVTRTTYR